MGIINEVERFQMLDAEGQVDVDRRLNRVAGQVAGIRRMVEEERYCVDVLTQIAAARAALAKVAKIMLEAHIKTCVREAFRSDDEADREAKIAELTRIFDKNCH